MRTSYAVFCLKLLVLIHSSPKRRSAGLAYGVGDSDAAGVPAGAGDDPDLDLTSVTGRTTDKDVFGHLGVAELSSGPSALPVFTGHRDAGRIGEGEVALCRHRL